MIFLYICDHFWDSPQNILELKWHWQALSKMDAILKLKMKKKKTIWRWNSLVHKYFEIKKSQVQKKKKTKWYVHSTIDSWKQRMSNEEVYENIQRFTDAIRVSQMRLLAIAGEVKKRICASSYIMGSKLWWKIRR